MRVLIAIPLLLILVAFALSNQQPVTVGLWPTDIQFVVPLSLAVLVACAVCFVAGAVMAWGGSFRHSARARRAERAAQRLEGELVALRGTGLGRPGLAVLPPPR